MTSCNCTGKCRFPPYTCSGVREDKFKLASESLSFCSHGISMQFECTRCDLDKRIVSIEEIIENNEIGIERLFEKLECVENKLSKLEMILDKLIEHQRSIMKNL